MKTENITPKQKTEIQGNNRLKAQFAGSRKSCLNRNFTATEANECGSVILLTAETAQGWLYLAFHRYLIPGR